LDKDPKAISSNENMKLIMSSIKPKALTYHKTEKLHDFTLSLVVRADVAM